MHSPLGFYIRSFTKKSLLGKTTEPSNALNAFLRTGDPVDDDDDDDDDDDGDDPKQNHVVPPNLSYTNQHVSERST